MDVHQRLHLIISRSIVGAVLSSFVLATQSSIAQSTPSISPADIGFQKTESFDSQLRKTISLKDPTNGYVLHTTYSSLGKIEAQVETTASGRILSRRELRANLELQEQFVPVHTRTIFHSKRPGWIAIEQTTWKNGNEKTFTYEINEKNALQKCDIESSHSPVDQLLSDMSWLSFQPESNGAAVPLGNNFVAENCASYPYGGVDGLARALTDALKTGLSCLASLGPDRKMDAAKMLAFLDEKTARKAKIRCGHVGDVTGRGGPDASHPGKYIPMIIEKDEAARAYSVDSPDFPALLFNLDSKTLGDAEGQAAPTLFHEMLHWLGYRHHHGIDVTYLSEICCFPSADDKTNNREQACQLLKDNPNFGSEEYHRRFTQVMDNIYQSDVGIKSAWSAIHGEKDSSPLLSSLLEIADSNRQRYERIHWDYRDKGDPLYYVVLARASLGNIPSTKKDAAIKQVDEIIDSVYPKGSIRDAAHYIGDAINALINGNAKAFKTSWAQFERIRVSACSQMNKNEKEELSHATNLAILDLLDAKPSLFKYDTRFETPCP